MDVEITISGTEDARGELESLLQWLNQEPDFRGLVEFKPTEVRPGELGSLEEILLAAIAAGGLDALGATVGVWLQTRRSDLQVTFRADGSFKEIRASGPVAKTVARHLFEGEGPERIGKGE
jgi:hypothetical protein